MDLLSSEIQYIIVAAVISALAFGARILFKWLKQSKNKLLNTIGDLAYEEIENTMNSSEGKEKMEAAIKVARKEMEKRKIFTSLTNEQLEAIIQEAWERSNAEKNTPQ
jgi:hypothetical protein